MIINIEFDYKDSVTSCILQRINLGIEFTETSRQ